MEIIRIGGVWEFMCVRYCTDLSVEWKERKENENIPVQLDDNEKLLNASVTFK